MPSLGQHILGLLFICTHHLGTQCGSSAAMNFFLVRICFDDLTSFFIFDPNFRRVPKRKFWLTWVSSFSSLTSPRFTALMLIFRFSSSTCVSIIARRGVTMIIMLFPSHWLNHELLTLKQCLVRPDKLKISYVQLARCVLSFDLRNND